MLSINMRSLCNKWDTFSYELLDNHIDVICCNETWLCVSIPDSLINCDFYQLFRLDRAYKNSSGTTKVGGGLCCYVKKPYSVDTQIYSNLNCSTSDLEVQCLQVKIGGNKPLIIVNLYRPPQGSMSACINTLDKVFDVLKSVRRVDIICLGDFNVDWLKSKDAKTVQLSQFAKRCCLEQAITAPSRVTSKTKTLIDLMFHNFSA